MKQETAQTIIEEAGQHHIAATLDASRTRQFKNGGGYRVQLVHRRARRVLVIETEEQWPSVLQAWQDL